MYWWLVLYFFIGFIVGCSVFGKKYKKYKKEAKEYEILSVELWTQLKSMYERSEL